LEVEISLRNYLIPNRLHWSSAFSTTNSCRFKAGNRSFADDAALEFGQRTKDVEYKPSPAVVVSITA
jgi:hypothetical protein